MSKPAGTMAINYNAIYRRIRELEERLDLESEIYALLHARYEQDPSPSNRDAVARRSAQLNELVEELSMLYDLLDIWGMLPGQDMF